MADLELQEEEREVLQSIYEGDDAFKQISPTVFQYKFGQEGDPKSFLLEISWGPTYPTEKPNFNMDTFYNTHIISEVKQQIVSAVSEEAEQFLSMAMTYSLFEFVKEKLEELTEGQPLTPDVSSAIEKVSISENQDESSSRKAEKKEQLSKSQKRKQWDRVDAKGEKPRGWNWIDIVKHLSQTGGKQTENLPTS